MRFLNLLWWSWDEIGTLKKKWLIVYFLDVQHVQTHAYIFIPHHLPSAEAYEAPFFMFITM